MAISVWNVLICSSHAIGRQCGVVVKNVDLRADCQGSAPGPATQCIALGRSFNLSVSQFLS